MNTINIADADTADQNEDDHKSNRPQYTQQYRLGFRASDYRANCPGCYLTVGTIERPDATYTVVQETASHDYYAQKKGSIQWIRAFPTM